MFFQGAVETFSSMFCGLSVGQCIWHHQWICWEVVFSSSGLGVRADVIGTLSSVPAASLIFTLSRIWINVLNVLVSSEVHLSKVLAHSDSFESKSTVKNCCWSLLFHDI